MAINDVLDKTNSSRISKQQASKSIWTAFISILMQNKTERDLVKINLTDVDDSNLTSVMNAIAPYTRNGTINIVDLQDELSVLEGIGYRRQDIDNFLLGTSTKQEILTPQQRTKQKKGQLKRPAIIDQETFSEDIEQEEDIETDKKESQDKIGVGEIDFEPEDADIVQDAISDRRIVDTIQVDDFEPVRASEVKVEEQKFGGKEVVEAKPEEYDLTSMIDKLEEKGLSRKQVRETIRRAKKGGAVSVKAATDYAKSLDTGLTGQEIERIAQEYEQEVVVPVKPMTINEINARIDTLLADQSKRGLRKELDGLIAEAETRGTPASVTGSIVATRVNKHFDPIIRGKRRESRQRMSELKELQASARMQALKDKSARDMKRQTEWGGAIMDVEVEYQTLKQSLKQNKSQEPGNTVRIDFANKTKPGMDFADIGVVATTVEDVIGRLVDVPDSRGGRSSMKDQINRGVLFRPENKAKKRATEILITETVQSNLIAQSAKRMIEDQYLKALGISATGELGRAVDDIANQVADYSMELRHQANIAVEGVGVAKMGVGRRAVFEGLSGQQFASYARDRITAALIADSSVPRAAIERIATRITDNITRYLPADIAYQPASKNLVLDQIDNAIPIISASTIVQSPAGETTVYNQDLVIDDVDPENAISSAVEGLKQTYKWNDFQAKQIEALAVKSLHNEYDSFMKRGAVGYVLSSHFILPYKQIVPQALQIKIAEANELLYGGDNKKAYEFSKAPVAVLNNTILNEMKLLTGLWGRDAYRLDPKPGKKIGPIGSYAKNPMFRPTMYGMNSINWALDRMTGWANMGYNRALQQRLIGGANNSWRGNLKMSLLRRNAHALNKRKGTQMSLLQFGLRMVLGTVGGAVVDATWDVARMTKLGKMLDAKLGSMSSGEGFFNGMKNAWKYGEGWARGTGFTGFAGKFLHGFNVVGVNGIPLAVKPLAKGIIIGALASAVGIPMPVYLATTGAYVGLDLLKSFARNPVFGLTYNPVTQFANFGPMSTRFSFFRNIALAFHTNGALFKAPIPLNAIDGATSAVDPSKLPRWMKYTRGIARYLPSEGLVVSQLLIALGVNPLLALGLGAGSQFGWRLFQRFIEIGPVGTFANFLGRIVARLNAVASVAIGLNTLDEMGGITNLLSAGWSWHTLGRLLGVASMYSGIGLVLGAVFGLTGLPLVGAALLVGTATALIDQALQWATGRSLWSWVFGPTVDRFVDLFGDNIVKIGGAILGMIIGFWKLLTARNLTELVDAAIVTGFGLIMGFGLLSAAGVVGSSLYMPTIPDPDVGELKSDYFKNVSKTLSSIENDGNFTKLKYNISYTYTGGLGADKELLRFIEVDQIRGIPSNLIDPSCSSRGSSMNPSNLYRGYQFYDDDLFGFPSFVYSGTKPMSSYEYEIATSQRDNNLGTFSKLRLTDIDKPVNFEFTLCIKGDLCSVLGGEDQTFQNLFSVQGIPSDPQQGGIQYPQDWSETKATAVDSRNCKGKSLGFSNPIIPGSGRVSQYFRASHHGLDLAFPLGTEVYASGSGTVTYAGWSKVGYGNLIYIEHANGYKTVYAHLNGIEVKVGDVVDTGNLIGYVGSTGRSSGPHLHFEVRLNDVNLDPCKHIYCNAYN